MSHGAENDWGDAAPTIDPGRFHSGRWASDVEQGPAGSPQSPRNTKPVMMIIGVLVIVVFGLIIAAAAALGLFSFGSGASASGPVTSTYTSTVRVAPDEQQAAPVAAEPVQDSRAVEPVPAGSIPANQGAMGAPAGDYSSVWRGTNVTSEPFANAVRTEFVHEYRRTGNTSPTLSVYSSVTGRFYTMTCSDNGSFVTCRGGNNAVVHIQ